MSLATRGVLLLLIVILLSVAPYAFAVRLRMLAERHLAAEGAAALLAAGLDQHLKSGVGGGVLGPWVGALAKGSGKIRWAAACGADGKCIEFVRRFALPREVILERVGRYASEPSFRPFAPPGDPDDGLDLLTIPSPTGDGTLAAVMELAAQNAGPENLTTLALAAGPLAALVAGLIGFHFAIVRPVRRLGACVERTETALRDVAAADAMPEELAALAQRVQESQEELTRWRGEAGALRHSMERRLEARTADVTKALRRAERAADTDALTQLANRRVLERELPGQFATQRENGDELSIIWIDINKFKEFNDTRGHQAGDELVRFAAQLIRTAARRQGDLAVRYGGDEFVVVLVGTALPEATDMARRLTRLFAQHVRTLGTLRVAPGISAGVASLQRSDPRDALDLLRLADEAMYEAKRGGTGVVAVERHGPG